MFKHFFTKSTNRKMEELKDVELVSEGIAISFNKLILAIHSRHPLSEVTNILYPVALVILTLVLIG